MPNRGGTILVVKLVNGNYSVYYVLFLYNLMVHYHRIRIHLEMFSFMATDMKMYLYLALLGYFLSFVTLRLWRASGDVRCR